MAKKTYVEKLNDVKDLPKIVDLNEEAQKKFNAKTMVVPKPTDIYNIMKNVPQGKLITTSEIRTLLSRQYNVDTACPLTTGIFVNISANASVELNDDMPYWRTLKSKGEINLKFPNAPEEQITLLENEGFEIFTKGKKNIKYFVKDYEDYLLGE
jgi:alkylated DNA nucleotide flippase Atl1